ncbi:hypothetical protein SAMN05421820_11775 [Pedobacter steynii]|uniref:Uncharacterized protein n=1 Tax=Pedobacter steynii TaxID=430522 RepID=A0A1H0L8I1_9SPHI|nr:hypothetical protein [Pedobacter steynii]NQX43438.1 hypothetical protein [Pedobacter steynii]SDO64250.1 hypothetical protein SAMN05421820_11775 [Pedobacter steynii]
MIFNSQEAFNKLITELNQRAIKYLIHEFNSGAIMIDIWHKDLFYVVQIEKDFAGLSLIDEIGSGFDTMPDAKFFTVDDFLFGLRNVIF